MIHHYFSDQNMWFLDSCFKFEPYASEEKELGCDFKKKWG